MLDGAHGGFDRDEVLRGKTTPVFFGSAANNFGVELLLNGFLGYSQGPAPRNTAAGPVPLDNPDFSGFIFKVQTNMNPMHRDRMVFARVCSGKFERDMKVFNSRLQKEIRISSAHNVFGRERETLSEAYAGDILGFITTTPFRVGDTITSNPAIAYEEITRFAPECFAYLHNTVTSSYKSFRKGFDHLLAEDIVQTFHLDGYNSHLPLLGAVGPLQFEVLQYRLRDEYGAESRLEMMPWTTLRWLASEADAEELEKALPYKAVTGKDEEGRPVLLFITEWSRDHFIEGNPKIKIVDTPGRETRVDLIRNGAATR